MLFSNEVMIKDDVLRQNLYLQKEYFKQLRDLISEIKEGTSLQLPQKLQINNSTLTHSIT